jgi:hypothetical protein
MLTLKKATIATGLFAALTSPSFAFFDEMIKGMTSVANNLIDSSESVTNNTINAASTNMLSLASNPGKMADRIGTMADRIGYMADRIVTTEGIMAGLAHKIIDSNQQPRVIHQYASTYAPAPAIPISTHYQANAYDTTYTGSHGNNYSHNPGFAPSQSAQNAGANPYLAASRPPVAATYAPSQTYAQPDNSRYSASHMLYGVSGATYKAAQPGYGANTYQAGAPTGYGLAAESNMRSTTNICALSYGVARSC